MININTKILGLIGNPLGHSLSPLLHNHTIKEKNLNYIYLPFPVKSENFVNAIKGLKAINVKGLNVTIPYKERIIDFLDEIDPIAEKIGAVNTIVNNGDIWKGYNTDVTGLKRMIKEDGDFDIKGKRAIVIGAGGAARATGITLLSEGVAEIYLLNRTLAKAKSLARDWKKSYPETNILTGGIEADFYKRYIKKIDILINTTPVGMEPNIGVPAVIEAKFLHKNILVVDLVYNPKETALLKAAKEVGADYINGMGMLLYQGIESFKLWTGIDIDSATWWDLV